MTSNCGVSRKKNAPRLSDEDWESHRDDIVELYLIGNLKTMMDKMKSYGFKASCVLPIPCPRCLNHSRLYVDRKRQYVYRLGPEKWGVNKYKTDKPNDTSSPPEDFRHGNLQVDLSWTQETLPELDQQVQNAHYSHHRPGLVHQPIDDEHGQPDYWDYPQKLALSIAYLFAVADAESARKLVSKAVRDGVTMKEGPEYMRLSERDLAELAGRLEMDDDNEILSQAVARALPEDSFVFEGLYRKLLRREAQHDERTQADQLVGEDAQWVNKWVPTCSTHTAASSVVQQLQLQKLKRPGLKFDLLAYTFLDKIVEYTTTGGDICFDIRDCFATECNDKDALKTLIHNCLRWCQQTCYDRRVPAKYDHRTTTEGTEEWSYILDFYFDVSDNMISQIRHAETPNWVETCKSHMRPAPIRVPPQHQLGHPRLGLPSRRRRRRRRRGIRTQRFPQAHGELHNPRRLCEYFP